MKKRDFIKTSALIGTGAMLANPWSLLAKDKGSFPVVRTPEAKRNFSSKAIEKAIKEFKKHVSDPELGWLFENCFPNTLDTTVTYTEKGGKPDTYVITGDIDAMWLRDSVAQVWPYMKFVDKDEKLKSLIAGVINRQMSYIIKDSYANAFYDDPKKVGEWASDYTDMKPGVHERKWEIDSLCYPIRLAYNYWKETGDTAPFDDNWHNAMKLVLSTFKDQQRKEGRGKYHFQRNTPRATDSLPMSGYGYPVNPVGLISSSFRPSDDATIYPFLIPSNFFAVVSLNQAAEMLIALKNDSATASQMKAMAKEVKAAIDKYAVVEHPKFGKIYAYEVNGFGSYNLMDDSNVPSLLSLPYLDAIDVKDPLYVNTRNYVLSDSNPFFFKGKAAEGIGGPHVGMDFIWPMSITMRGLTSTDNEEIKECIQMLKKTHGGTGFMHEGFHKDDPTNFTRSWFAWANTLFGEFLYKTYETAPNLLKA